MRRAAHWLVLTVLLVVGGAPMAFAQAAEPAPSATAPRIKSKLTPSTLQVGEVAKLVIEVDAPSDSDVSLPEQSFGGLELTERHVRTLAQGARTLTTYELDLLALEAGKVELPALNLRFVGSTGELSSGHTEPQELTVRSLIANEPNAEPKPVTRPVSVMHDDYTIAWVGLALLAIALIAAATLLISRWLKKRPRPPEPLPAPRPAWELAIERLHGLLEQKETLFANERGEEFVDGVSDALREYLGRRYGFDGLERTTGELMTTLERLRPHKLSLSGVSLLLDECDLVKFARAKPDADQCQDLWNGAVGLIRATTPLHEPLAAVQTASVPPPSVPPPARPSLPPVSSTRSLPPAPWDMPEAPVALPAPSAAPASPTLQAAPVSKPAVIEAQVPWDAPVRAAVAPPSAPPAPWETPASVPPPSAPAPRSSIPPPPRPSLPPPTPRSSIPPPPPRPRGDSEKP